MPAAALPSAFTNDAMVLTKIKTPSSVEVTLMDFQGKVKKVLDEIETSRPDRIFISSTPTRIIINYSEMDPKGKIARVYDLESNQVFVLRHEGGRVAFPVASSRDGKILYQRRIDGEPTKICMTNANGQNPQYIADGIGQFWLPDGKGYVWKPSNMNPVEAYKHGKVSKEEAQQELEKRKKGIQTPEIQYRLFHEDLSSPKLIPDLKNPNPQIVFSPKGEYLGIFDDGILYSRFFSIRDGELEFSDQELIDKANASYEIDRVFSWDPKGEKLAYTRLYLDEHGHGYVNSDIFIYDLATNKTVALTATPNNYEENPIWIGSGDLIIHKKANLRREGNVVKMSIQY